MKIKKTQVNFTQSDLVNAIEFLKDKKTITPKQLNLEIKIGVTAISELIETLVELDYLENFTGENFKRKVLIKQ